MKSSLKKYLTTASAALFLTMMAGCSTNPNAELAAADLEARKLAMSCYSEREGDRLVYGGGQVWQMCAAWAKRVVANELQALSAVTEASEDTAIN